MVTHDIIHCTVHQNTAIHIRNSFTVLAFQHYVPYGPPSYDRVHTYCTRVPGVDLGIFERGARLERDIGT